jgi:hypothetical protein
LLCQAEQRYQPGSKVKQWSYAYVERAISSEGHVWYQVRGVGLVYIPPQWSISR